MIENSEIDQLIDFTSSFSLYSGIISDAILELQELGILQELKNMWWSIKKGGGQCGPKDGAQKAAGAASELGLANVGGVFVVLAGGSVIAVVICVSEFIWKMKQIPRAERDNIFIELMRELKHVICCYGSTRPVRRNTVDDLGSQVGDPKLEKSYKLISRRLFSEQLHSAILSGGWLRI